ncbi:MAG: nucleotidyltransferase domain-containing protein [Deltaproteobacteria bacterium]|nr:nucleotidyltransferase domain-containing protein [Deltaproteobacteria bacterium]MBN2673504.1 nucleotidyltransferase domain-containing protein [Deltaproteobacteria bacterium]
MSVSIEEAARFQQEKAREQSEKCAALHARASADFARMVTFIRKQYPHVGIFQWGSILQPDSFDELSDVDIALTEVTSPREYFEIQGTLMKMTDFPLDCIELDKISPENREMLLRKGKWIHEPK